MIVKNKNQISTNDASRIILTQILTMFINLQSLKLGLCVNWYQQLSFEIAPPTFHSSTLLGIICFCAILH